MAVSETKNHNQQQQQQKVIRKFNLVFATKKKLFLFLSIY